MLRVIQTKSSAGAKSYYSQSDYLSEGQELVGRWGGKASQLLGLSGEVDKQSFDRLCDNLDPRSGERLTLRTNAERTVGYDFNFHVPKGVSLAYTLNHDDRVLSAFRASVEETMQEIEADAATRVRKHDMQEERITGNLAWATFVHTTARPVNGEPDPHLHAHCFVFNTTFDSVEESWKAGQFRELKRDASYYEAAFHARLASRMNDLGFEIQRNGRTWDIGGIEKSTLDKFSRRTTEIEKLAEELGIEDDHAKDDLGAKTRAKKDKGMSMSELVERWNGRLDEGERQSIAKLGQRSANDRETTKNETREAEAMSYAKLHCFERNSVVAKRQLLGEALRHGVGDVTVDGIHEQFNQQGIISRSMHGREWATTPEVLAEERFMIKHARDGRDSTTPLNDTWSIKRDWMNAGQKDAVQLLLESRDSVIMIRGGAGTGKTTLMHEAIEGIEAGGRKVLTFAPSAQASRGVLAGEGFKATTVAELLISQELQAEAQGNVIWVDEAGLLGTRTLKQVMEVADKVDARLVLSGDWKQHGAVERGAAMAIHSRKILD
jgi:conjugative relaxase-like TrwC/TraI family protein